VAPGDGSAFRHLGDEVVYDGSRRLSLVRGSFSAPDGSTFTRDVVRTQGAVAIVPLLDDGEMVVLVRQYRGPIDATILEIPAGLLDVEGEDPIDCARRELVEEVGYEAASVEQLLRSHVAVGITDHVVTVFLATGLTEVGQDRQGPEEEHMTVERLSLRAVPGLVADGTLTDGKTIMGLLAAREHLGVR
jgi:8-oxo-dGTP pyrophosphatase MutT (NUDIX family)